MAASKDFKARRLEWLKEAHQRIASKAARRPAELQTTPEPPLALPATTTPAPEPAEPVAPATPEPVWEAPKRVSRLSPETQRYLDDLRRNPPSDRPLLLGVYQRPKDHMVPKMETPKQAVFNPEQLKVIGRAPLCPDCPEQYMAPLNDPTKPDMCRCAMCGREARFRWVT